MSDTYYAVTRHDPRIGDGLPSIRLQLTGEFDLSTRELLRETLDGMIASSESSSIVVDLDEVTFVDSEAVGALVDGYHAAIRAGHLFRLVNARGPVDRVFSILGLTSLFADRGNPNSQPWACEATSSLSPHDARSTRTGAAGRQDEKLRR